mmetsp:Transcript_2538/g.6047  ORF Transcript_2538/g.6047 Transcript_2538/m.6047 type:complete len:407 (-) Transcript_2538:723-1943(-)
MSLSFIEPPSSTVARTKPHMDTMRVCSAWGMSSAPSTGSAAFAAAMAVVAAQQAAATASASASGSSQYFPAASAPAFAAALASVAAAAAFSAAAAAMSSSTLGSAGPTRRVNAQSMASVIPSSTAGRSLASRSATLLTGSRAKVERMTLAASVIATWSLLSNPLRAPRFPARSSDTRASESRSSVDASVSAAMTRRRLRARRRSRTTSLNSRTARPSPASTAATVASSNGGASGGSNTGATHAAMSVLNPGSVVMYASRAALSTTSTPSAPTACTNSRSRSAHVKAGSAPPCSAVPGAHAAVSTACSAGTQPSRSNDRRPALLTATHHIAAHAFQRTPPTMLYVPPTISPNASSGRSGRCSFFTASSHIPCMSSSWSVTLPRSSAALVLRTSISMHSRRSASGLLG